MARCTRELDVREAETTSMDKTISDEDSLLCTI